jgi:UDP-galactopyranose mutase
MKKKLAEAISTTDIDVNLKLIDNDSKELWAISSSDLPTISISNLPVSTNIDDKQSPKFQVF